MVWNLETLLFIKSMIKKMSTIEKFDMNTLLDYVVCHSILGEHRQTYVSKTAKTNKMTKKRKFSATTATWSMFPSAS